MTREEKREIAEAFESELQRLEDEAENMAIANIAEEYGLTTEEVVDIVF